MRGYVLTKIKRHFINNSLTDPADKLSVELKKLRPLIKPGAHIALAAGSRGIRNLAPVVRQVAEFVRENKAHPFIIPAMGCHGGATAPGQADVLAGYGITEETTGAPVRSSMEVVDLPPGNSPTPVFMDRLAYESDGVILINRIKPHTDFHARYESGLVKMSVIGLGKDKQAVVVHSFGVYGLSQLIPQIAWQVFSTGKILGGIAMVENARDETMIIKALRSDEIFEQEPRLLNIARRNMASLPVDDIDVLMIDQMGKEISGVGIDTNVIGRIGIAGQKEPRKPRIKAIAVLDLTDGSYGNATGMGLCDIISRRLFDKIDFSATFINVMTSSFLERGKVPVVANTDLEVFGTALRSCGYVRGGEERIMRIRDTLHLDEMYVSRPVLDSLKDSDDFEVLADDIEVFNDEGECNPF